MCGILAVVSVDATPLDAVPPDVRGLVDRGPDNVGLLAGPRVVLAHTRLAVIDRNASSNQPIRNGAAALVCNGEIFNFRALRARADADGYRYATSSDCEAPLHTYAARGLAGFQDLDGFYAFVLHDAAAERVVLHRDPVGKKPLFVMIEDGRLVAASTVTALLHNRRRGLPEIDREQVAHYLQHGFVHPARSLFRDIRPLRPGEILTVDLRAGTVHSTDANKPVPAYDGFDWADERAVDAELDRLIRAAVDKRLQGLERPVLVFSGGIDSTVLADEMVGIAGARTRLVTMRQPLPVLNDEPWARLVARRLGSRLRVVPPWRDLRRRVREALRKADQPFGVPSYVYLSLLAREARRFGNVLFTGDGADEVFFGYRPAADWMANGQPAGDDVRVGPPFRFPLSPYGARQGAVDLLGHGFVKVDKATAENQMEARCPFLDWTLMAFVRQIPQRYWLAHGDVVKYPLKRLLLRRGYPPRFVHRAKIGFALPFRWLMAPMLGEMRRTVAAHHEGLHALGALDDPATGTLATFRHFEAAWRTYALAEYVGRIGAA